MNSRRVLIGAGIGCVAIAFLGLLLFGAVMCGASIGVQKAKQQATTDKQETTEDQETTEPSKKNKRKTANTPKQDEDEGEYIPVVIRVSGEQGTPYKCSYTSFAFEGSERVMYTSDESGTLGPTPVEYTTQAINAYPWYYDWVSANCLITGVRAAGSLKLEMIANGQVKKADETRPDPPNKKSNQSTNVEVRWAPRCLSTATSDVACG